MQDPNENTFNELADILLSLLDVSPDTGKRITIATMLKNAYTSGLLAGVDLASAGIEFAAQLDAEERQNATSSESRGCSWCARSPPTVVAHEHPSPREAMAAAGWVTRDTGAQGHR